MDLFGELEPTNIIKEEIITDSQEPLIIRDFEHPRFMSFCLGHEEIEKWLGVYLNTGLMPHGLIFCGLQGIGKATLAYRFIKKLLGQEKLILSGSHPDLMVVERLYDPLKNTTKTSVEVSEVRKVAPFLRMTPSFAGWRVVIIDDADTMNRNAQNALLKILEEPPEKTLIILIAHRLGALIPTIRSRAQLIHFSPLGLKTIAHLFEKSGRQIDEQVLKQLLDIAGGSFGQCLKIYDQGGLDILMSLYDLLNGAPEMDWVKVHALSEEVSRTNEDFDTFAALFQNIFQKALRQKASGTQANYGQPKIIKNSSLEQTIKICENLQSIFAKTLEAHLDKRQAVLQAFSLLKA